MLPISAGCSIQCNRYTYNKVTVPPNNRARHKQLGFSSDNHFGDFSNEFRINNKFEWIIVVNCLMVNFTFPWGKICKRMNRAYICSVHVFFVYLMNSWGSNMSWVFLFRHSASRKSFVSHWYDINSRNFDIFSREPIPGRHKSTLWITLAVTDILK